MVADRFKARPTTYKGIKMRSRLEAGYAMWLDRLGFTWAYEPECFADDAGQYLPDFRIDNVPDAQGGPRSTVFVEVKPAKWSGDMDALGARMDIIGSSFDGPHMVVLERPGALPVEPFVMEGGTVDWLAKVWVPFYDATDETYGYALAWPDGFWNGPRGGG